MEGNTQSKTNKNSGASFVLKCFFLCYLCFFISYFFPSLPVIGMHLSNHISPLDRKDDLLFSCPQSCTLLLLFS